MRDVGHAATLKTYDKLNQRCIPQPLPATGHPAVGDPVNHPWTTSAGISYTTEAVHLGRLHRAAPRRVRRARRRSPRWDQQRLRHDLRRRRSRRTSPSRPHKDDIELRVETFEPTAPTITEPMTTLAAGEARRVHLHDRRRRRARRSITEAAQNGMKEAVKYKFLALGLQGDAARSPRTRSATTSDGWWSVGGGLKDIASPAYDKDPFDVAARQLLTDAGYDYQDPIIQPRDCTTPGPWPRRS